MLSYRQCSFVCYDRATPWAAPFAERVSSNEAERVVIMLAAWLERALLAMQRAARVLEAGRRGHRVQMPPVGRPKDGSRMMMIRLCLFTLPYSV